MQINFNFRQNFICIDGKSFYFIISSNFSQASITCIVKNNWVDRKFINYKVWIEKIQHVWVGIRFNVFVTKVSQSSCCRGDIKLSNLIMKQLRKFQKIFTVEICQWTMLSWDWTWKENFAETAKTIHLHSKRIQISKSFEATRVDNKSLFELQKVIKLKSFQA